MGEQAPPPDLRSVRRADWQRYIDEAGGEVPLYDLPHALAHYSWLWLGGPRPPLYPGADR